MSNVHSSPINGAHQGVADQLLRGCISAAGDLDPEEAFINFRRLEAAGVEWANDEDSEVYGFLQGWVGQYVETVWDPEQKRERQVCELPDWGHLRQHFERADKIEVVARLDEVKKAVPRIRTTYRALIAGQQEGQKSTRLGRMMSRVQNINLNGERRKGGEVLRGWRAALDVLAEESRTLLDAVADTPFAVTDVAAPVDPVRYLLRHYRLAEGRPNGLVGYAGTSKTFLAIELCIAVAAGLGTAWGGCDLSLQGPVAHLDYEMGAKMSARRYQRIAHGLGVDLAGLTGSGRLCVSNFPTVNLVTPGCESELKRLCDGKALLLIDSFRAATPGGAADENSSSFRTYLDMLSRVSSETGAVVLVVHHERKAPQGGDAGMKVQTMRGSSGLADAFGATVHVEPVKEGGFNIVQGKVSAGRTGASKRCRLEDSGARNEAHDDSEGLLIRNVDITADEMTKPFRQVEAVLRVIEGQTGRDGIAKALQKIGSGMHNDRIIEVVTQLTEEGRIEKRGKAWHVVNTDDLLQ